MFTYVVKYIKRTHLFIHFHAIIQVMFTFNSFLVFQNIICKINIITHFTRQWFFYTHRYIIGGLGMIDNIKGWLQTTETTTIQLILTIFKHWGLTVKLHFLHIFFISDWNFKTFKCIFILFFFMLLVYFPIEIRFKCDKLFFGTIKIKIKPILWSCRLTL